MCDPLTLTGIGIAEGVNRIQTARRMKSNSKAAARLQASQVRRAQAQETKATAQANFNTQRERLAAKGQVQNSGLSDRSESALLRAIDYTAGQELAVRDANLDTGALNTAAALRGIQITRTSEDLQIGDTSGFAAFSAGLSGGVQGFNTGLEFARNVASIAGGGLG